MHSVRVAITSLLLFGVLECTALPASAQLCVQRAVALPGLSGGPHGSAADASDTLMPEQADPRWLAAPRRSFESDVTSVRGAVRVLVDSEAGELNVELAAFDDGEASNADAVYFGFTTDGTAGTLAKAVKLPMPTLGVSPRAVTSVQTLSYDVGGAQAWNTSLGAADWLVEPVAYAGDTSPWAFYFKVDLALAGLSSEAPFRMMLAVHMQNESTPAESIDLSTPDPGAEPLVAGTLIVEDPTKWAETSALADGCADAIGITAQQMGTRAPDGSQLDVRPGAQNRLFAAPTFGGSSPLFAGVYQGAFYLVPCGASSAPDASWRFLATAASDAAGALEIECPPNTDTQTCGVPTPTDEDVCLAVALQASVGQTVNIEPAIAFRPLELVGAPSAPDAGPSAPDAGTSQPSDAGNDAASGDGDQEADASVTPEHDETSCSCTAPGAPRGQRGEAALPALLLLSFAWRRRR
jgi:MYXO-CTERM domain-containing protein